MFLDVFKITGRADLALSELNNSNDFLNEFRSVNKDIRSSIANLQEFTHNHLEKMLKTRGFKNVLPILSMFMRKIFKENMYKYGRHD